MPRVLIVTSMYLPYLSADMHRARLLAASLPAHGWDVELLVPGDAFHPMEYFEPHADLVDTGVAVHRADPEWHWLFRILKSRTLGPRAYRPLRRLGNKLLSKGRFDLIYFSCAQTMFFHLGVGWRRRYCVPFVIDIHDPWYSPNLVSKGVSWKRRVANFVAGILERATLASASGLVSVSQGFLDILNDRYCGRKWRALLPHYQRAIPFGASRADYEAAGQLPKASVFEANTRTIVYTGAGSAIMEKSFRRICRLLSAIRRQQPELLTKVRIHLYGTEPQACGCPTLTKVIAEEGVADVIAEHPARLSYLEALHHVCDADGLLVLGVDYAAYNPSKLFLYGLTGKPILACMCEGSVVDRYYADATPPGRLIHFPRGDDEGAAADLAATAMFLEDVIGRRVVDPSALPDTWSASAMARQHSELFNSWLNPA